MERMAAETLAIADAPVGITERGTTNSGAVQKQRLQGDTRKWMLSKLAPKRYGDRVTNEKAQLISLQAVDRRIAAAQEELAILQTARIAYGNAVKQELAK